MKIVAIHQPNFFPWLGYFDKIARSNAFIFLDSVQFPKKGGSWSNRVKLLINGEARWVTAAIDRNYSGTRTMRQMSFLENIPWRKKVLKSIEANYRRHPFFVETMQVIEPLLLNNDSNIAEYNIKAVTHIAQVLGIDVTKFKCSSEYSANGHSNKLLCNLTLRAGASAYMCGGGADGYQDESIFEEKGIRLKYQNFDHPVYPQRGQDEFVPGLSIIDTAMNMGWRDTGSLLLRQRC